MAYFYCGTEGADYEAHYCDNCVHGNAEHGCPVFNAHWLYSYELCNKKEDPGKVILDMLIPEGEHGPAQCSLFIRKPTPGRIGRNR
jgi:hypothetical protein